MTHSHGDAPLLALIVLVVGYEALTLRPARGRPWSPWRATAVLSQLLYAGVIGDPGIPVADRRAGATLLYYGADAAEVLLAVALAAVPVRRRRATPLGPRRAAVAGAATGRPSIDPR